jgi:hypothetical protein
MRSIIRRRPRMHLTARASYRSLEILCRKQAALASTKETRTALEAMATEYRKLADWVERQSLSEADH